MDNDQNVVKKRSGSSFFRIIGIVLVVVIIVAAGYFFLVGQGGGAVAVVNGQNITRSEYDKHYAQLAATIASQGRSATTTEMQTAIKSQTLDDLVTETLLLQAAGKESIKANPTAVDTQFTQSKSQFPDEAAFQKALTDQGFTDSTFRETLTKSNIIQQYLSAHISTSTATASDAEIKALYDQAAGSGSAVPPLSEVRAQVESQIIQQKQQLLVTDFIAQLKASSTVNVLLK